MSALLQQRFVSSLSPNIIYRNFFLILSPFFPTKSFLNIFRVDERPPSFHRHGSLSSSLFDDVELDDAKLSSVQPNDNREAATSPIDTSSPTSEPSAVVALNNDSDPIYKAGVCRVFGMRFVFFVIV